MATQVDHVVERESSDSGMGFFLGILLLIIVILFLFYFGLPYFRGAGTANPQINVPDKVDVNVKQNPQ